MNKANKTGWKLVAILALLPQLVFAHSPHHVISDVATAPAGPESSHTFILVTDQLFRSEGEAGPWKNLVKGINSQYVFTSLAISPAYADDRTVFVASSGDGVYRSTDQGNSWAKTIAGLGRLDIHLLSVSESYASDGRLLAAAESGGVWRSVDNAENWQMVLSEGTVITAFTELPGSGGATILAGDAEGNVWRSEDSGRLWEIVYELPDVGAITSVAALADRIYIGTVKDGLYRSTDRGVSFERVLQPDQLGKPLCRLGDAATDRHITSVTASGNRRLLVSSWYGGVFVSENGGDSWSPRQNGLSCDVQADQIGTAHFQKIVVLPHAQGSTLWLGAFDGLFRSTGDAREWQQIETLPLNQIKGMAVTAAEQQPLVVGLSTYGGGFYLTEDNGEAWTIGNRGLQTTRLTGLSFSPDFARDNTLYAGASRRLLRSSDRGQSWQRIDIDEPSFSQVLAHRFDRIGLPSAWLRSDEDKRGPKYPTHLAALAGDHYGTVLIATRYHGLMSYSAASGEVESVWSGTDEVMGTLAIAPGSGAQSTMFSSVRGLGVIRSENGGEDWVSVNKGLDFIADWAANPDRGDFRRDIDIAVSPSFASDKTVFAGSPAANGLYQSTDGGNSWQSTNTDFGLQPAPVLAVAIAPNFAQSGSLMLSVKGAGLFLSNDRGKSFAAVASELIDANASIDYLEYSPNYAADHSIVAASDESLFVSSDHGSSWQEVPRPVRYEDMRDVVVFNGDWERRTDERFSARTQTTSATKGDSVTLRFIGGGVRWLGATGPDCGSAEVTIDDKPAVEVSCRAAEAGLLQPLYTDDSLAPGPHTLQIRVTSGAVAVDAFDVLP